MEFYAINTSAIVTTKLDHFPKRILRAPHTFKSVGVKEHEVSKDLMMCRVVIVFNPETGRKCQVGMIIDNGSTDTYITKRLAENLKLKEGPFRDVEMVRFGDTEHASHNIRGAVGRIGIQTETGPLVAVKGIIIQEFLPPIQHCTAKKYGRFALKEHYQKMPPGAFVEPDLLIGIDNLHLFNIKFEKVLENGYALYGSTVGPFVCGRPKNTAMSGGVTSTALCDQINIVPLPCYEEPSKTIHPKQSVVVSTESGESNINKGEKGSRRIAFKIHEPQAQKSIGSKSQIPENGANKRNQTDERKEYGDKISSFPRIITGKGNYGIGSIGCLPNISNSISYGCLSINMESLGPSAKQEKQILPPTKDDCPVQFMRKSSLEMTTPVLPSAKPTDIENVKHHHLSGGSVANKRAREMEINEKTKMSLLEKILCYMW